MSTESYTSPQGFQWAKLLHDMEPSCERLEKVMRSGWLSFLLEEGQAIPPLPKGVKREFEIWKTIFLGLHRSAAAYLQAFESLGLKASDWARDVLGKPAFQCASQKLEIDLVLLSVADLGFERGATFAQICQRAKELGLELCPNEVGPALRLQYLDQPLNQCIQVAMEPIRDSVRYLRVWFVGHGDDDRFLYCYYVSPGLVWGPGDLWVFAARKCPIGTLHSSLKCE